MTRTVCPPSVAPAPVPEGGGRVGRDGRLRLVFSRRGARTVLADAGWTSPVQTLAPIALGEPVAVVSIVNPTGGLVGGDRLRIDVDVGPAAHAVLTTPSATKVYRTAAEPATQTVALRLRAGAILEWVPDHTIPFAGAAFRQLIDVELGDGATLVLVDAFAAGRVARGEAWRFKSLDSALAVRDREGWVVHDRLVLGGAEGGWDSLGLAESNPYFATLMVLGGDVAGPLATLVPATTEGGRLAVARLPRRGALVRVLARDAPTLETLVAQSWSAARRAALGLGPFGLRKP